MILRQSYNNDTKIFVVKTVIDVGIFTMEKSVIAAFQIVLYYENQA